jgi:hypothetical protein
MMSALPGVPAAVMRVPKSILVVSIDAHHEPEITVR